MPISESQVYLAIAAIAAALLYHAYKAIVQPTKKPTALKISQLYIYPIKSLQATHPPSALATPSGFQHDRTFMLLQSTPSGELKNMAVSRYPEMTRFFPSLDLQKSTLTVTYKPVKPDEESRTLDMPLKPDTSDLSSIDISMHSSSTSAFRMPDSFNKWFSECFGYDVILVYLGEGNKRPVLFKDIVASSDADSASSTLSPSIAVAGKPQKQSNNGITFADCAPYLVVSQTSLREVSNRLPEDEEMDVTKFRPNIVLEGAAEAWEEDYWRRIKIQGAVEMELSHNCPRCVSINIDYNTGAPGTGESGKVLKKLQKDRRVDTGMKYSPVFGRYSFWRGEAEGKVLKVGDAVEVVGWSKERTSFSWPGLS